MNQAPGSGHRLRWRATLTTLALVAASLVVTSPVAADVRVTVRAGDSLSLLSLEYGVSVSAIMAANGITNPDLLYMGQELVIPGVGPSAATTSVVVTVEWGDSLSAIATDYGVSVSALMEANGIVNANAIFEGQELVVPGVSGPLLPAGPAVVTVTSGDTLSEIAERYGVGLSALMSANSLTNADTIYIGQQLTIPGTGPPPTTTLPPLRVTVVAGDNLSGIAATYGVTISAIVEANDLANPNLLTVGQELLIPGVYGSAAASQFSTDYGPVFVDGRGWGHGRGMGQYGALGYAIDEGWTRNQILDHYYGGTTAGSVSDQDIGVRLLAHDSRPTTVYVESALLAVAGESGDWTQVDGQAVRVTLEGDADRYRVATGSSCTGSFSDTGLVIASPIVRIRAAHMAPPGATTTTTTTTTVPPEGATTTTTTTPPDDDEPGWDDPYADCRGTEHCENPPAGFGSWDEYDAANDPNYVPPTTTVPPEGATTTATTTTAPPTTTVPPSGSVFQDLDTNEADLDWTLQVCEGTNGSSWYRGEIRAARAGSHQRTVNWLPVEQYLRSVVPREMPADWGDMGGGAGMAALEVQAVAARSYALAEHRYEYAKTCDSIRCQVYEGRRTRLGSQSWSNEDPRSDNAISATSGLVRMQDGEVARTEFSASTGGHTITADFPGVPDAGDDVEINPVHRWSKELSVADVASRFGLGPLYEIEVVVRDGFGDDGGRAEEIEFRARDGQRFTVTGNRFRREFGLKSNWYGVTYGPPEAATSFPEERLDEYRITTGYTDDEWVSVDDSAAYLGMTPAEFQLAAIWAVAFLLNLSADPNGPGPIAEPPVSDGPHWTQTAYFARQGDQAAAEQVAEAFSITGEQAQKVAVTILAFLVQLAKAAGR